MGIPEDYFEQFTAKEGAALGLILSYGDIDGAHHKDWVLDQGIEGPPTKDGIYYVVVEFNNRYRGTVIRKHGELIYEISMCQLLVKPSSIRHSWAMEASLPPLPSETESGQP